MHFSLFVKVDPQYSSCSLHFSTVAHSLPMGSSLPLSHETKVELDSKVLGITFSRQGLELKFTPLWSLPDRLSLSVRIVAKEVLTLVFSKSKCLRFLWRCQRNGLERFLNCAEIWFELSWSSSFESPSVLLIPVPINGVADLDKLIRESLPRWSWLDVLRLIPSLEPTQLMKLEGSSILNELLNSCISDIELTLPTNDLFFLDPEKKWWLNHHLCGLVSIFKKWNVIHDWTLWWKLIATKQK